MPPKAMNDFALQNPSLPTNYRRVRPDEPLVIIGDFGNTDVKGMIHTHFGEEIYFPHVVRKPTHNDYNILAQGYKHRAAQFEGTAIFEYDGQGYVIGAHAAQVGYGETLIGASKYSRDHLGALFSALMVQLYPESHNNVTLVVLHPTDVSVENLKELWKSLKGKHTVNLPDGRVLTYNVTQIFPIEEPVAGLQTFLFNTEGRVYTHPRIHFKPNMNLLILDIGGGISSFVPGYITQSGKIEVNLSGGLSMPVGIREVVHVFERELRSAFSDLQRVQKIPLPMLHHALMNDEFEIKGEMFECGQQVTNAMQSLAYPIYQEFANRFGYGVPYGAIVISGGGGGVSFNYLASEVLNHPNLFPAEDQIFRMRFSNIRGASKGFISFLSAQRR